MIRFFSIFRGQDRKNPTWRNDNLFKMSSNVIEMLSNVC